MAGIKKYLVITFAILSLTYSSGTNLVYAYDAGTGADSMGFTLPTQISGLINSAKQLWQSFAGGTTPASTGPISFQKSLENTNTWLVNTTGLNFTQIVKAIGGFAVWVLSFATDLIKWGLSLIK